VYEARSTKKLHQINLHQKLSTERTKARWTDAVQNDIRRMRIANWRQVAEDRDGWRGGTGEGLVLLDSGDIEEEEDTEEEEEEEEGGGGGKKK